MLKVVLAQLNTPSGAGTIPLAAGYLKAMAHKCDLTKNVDIEILDKKTSNFFGDSDVIQHIVEKQPDIVGFSCYVWNIERTVYIINQIKSRIPKLKTICGGTEVSSQYKRFLRNKNIDIVVIGEGELTFIELLRNFLHNKPKLGEIQGIAFKRHRKIIVTSQRKQIGDVNIIPSPYLLGFIDVKEYGRLFIETYRGCIEKCAYCNWNRNFQGIRYFSEERIKNEMKLARKKKVNCEIIDPIFNLPYNLSRISKSIIEINKDKSVKLAVSGRAEYINQKTLDILLKCNVSNISIGLQSINPVALANVNRWSDRKLFIRGINLLKKAKISFRTDFIIGLPGDTEHSIKKTLEAIEKFSVPRETYCDILQVQPDAKLRKQAEKFNLKFLTKRPYYVLSTNSLSRQGLKRIASFCYRKYCESFPVRQSNVRFFKNILAFEPFLFFPQKDYKEIPPNDFLPKDKTSHFIVEINSSKQTVKKIKNLADELKRSVTLQTTIFFRCFQAERKYLLIKEFLNQISKTNPSTEFSIIVENVRFSNEKTLIKLQNAINHISNYAESAEKYYRELLNVKRILDKCSINVIQPFSASNLYGEKKMRKEIPLISKIKIVEETQWKDLLLKSLKTSDGPILIDLEDYIKNPSFAAQVLKYIVQSRSNEKTVFFSDYALQIFYDEILMKKHSLLDIIKKFKNITAKIQNKAIYVNENLNIYFLKCNFHNTLLKLIDLKKYEAGKEMF